MKFILLKALDEKYREEIEINTIGNLKTIESKHPGWHGEGGRKDFIITLGTNAEPGTIMIYDDYIE